MAAKDKKNGEPEPGTGLAVLGAGTTDVALAKELEGLSGLGYSEKPEDSLVPILSILQDNSGEVKKGHSKRIEGAEPGFLIIRSMKRILDAGKAPFLFQPCAFGHNWVEWFGEPGDGYPVGQFEFEARPEDAIEVEDPQNPERKIWRRSSTGNRLVDTRYHFGHMIEGDVTQPLVVPMSGSNHSVSRGWTNLMKEQRIPGSGQRAPAWFRIWRLKTIFRQRGQQSWYQYEVADAGWVSDPDLRARGRQMFENSQQLAADLEAEAAQTGGEPGDLGGDTQGGISPHGEAPI